MPLFTKYDCKFLGYALSLMMSPYITLYFLSFFLIASFSLRAFPKTIEIVIFSILIVVV